MKHGREEVDTLGITICPWEAISVMLFLGNHRRVHFFLLLQHGWKYRSCGVSTLGLKITKIISLQMIQYI